MGRVRFTRLLALSDVPVLTELVQVNRAFLAPWEPVRDEAYFTRAGQLLLAQAALVDYAQGTRVPHVILDEDGAVVGRVNLNNVVRAAFQSCDLGYWLSEASTGRGLATGAVGEIMRVAFEEHGLHRIQAGTLVHNVASQRVLERNGFVRLGLAPNYLQIAGRWQDHILYQAVADGVSGSPR
jgi:[ribosomal protein S5]-alanine N-acetyltransferase